MTFLKNAVPLFCIVTFTLAREARLVKLDDAVNDGAVCLDGSPPGYYYREGELGPTPSHSARRSGWLAQR